MLDRPDLVLATIPLLAVSGLAVRTVVASTGVATGILAAPLATMGFLAAGAIMCYELVAFDPAGRGPDGSERS